MLVKLNDMNTSRMSPREEGTQQFVLAMDTVKLLRTSGKALEGCCGCGPRMTGHSRRLLYKLIMRPSLGLLCAQKRDLPHFECRNLETD